MTINSHGDAGSLTALLTADVEIVTERPGRLAAVTPDRACQYYGEDDITYTCADFGAATARTEDEVRAFAELTMPKHMPPRHIRVVPDVPRTPTSKTEKYKLRALLLDELADGGPGR